MKLNQIYIKFPNSGWKKKLTDPRLFCYSNFPFLVLFFCVQLVKSHGIDHSLIPPKKYFGFLQPEYVERRRQALEAYFETLLSTFEENLPKELLEFLETDKFVSVTDWYCYCPLSYLSASLCIVIGQFSRQYIKAKFNFFYLKLLPSIWTQRYD